MSELQIQRAFLEREAKRACGDAGPTLTYLALTLTPLESLDYEWRRQERLALWGQPTIADGIAWQSDPMRGRFAR